LLLERYPQQAVLHYNLGIAYFMTRRYREGIAAFRRTLELDGPVDAHIYLAKCYAHLGYREEAIYHLRRRIALRSGDDQLQVDEAIAELSLYFPEKQ
jgi:tetratricopeptide (TPR) repeat protein